MLATEAAVSHHD